MTPIIRCLWIITVVSLSPQSSGRKVHRCYLARKLNEVGWNRWNVNNFLCVADFVSGNEMNLSKPRAKGQRLVGIFQIPSKFYCFDKFVPGMRNGKCHALCSAFLDEDLDDDVMCASYIRWQYGFEFWHGWERACQQKVLSNLLDGCDVKVKPGQWSYW
ncbi:lysozyme C, milk isozyme-like [Galendromus occidentalis]|uniref:lysozyme n=1 Tax=Galendromus occidentalis TaxID=34638 RepID=A0AAJ6QTX1_9ACAR|nr:lysozyme C, milk isozyme-like [Galendromus occidentalis]